MHKSLKRWSGLAIIIVLALGSAILINAFTSQAVAKPPSGGGGAGSSNNAFAVGGISLVDGGHVAFAAQQNPQRAGQYAGYVVQEDLNGNTNSGPVACLYSNGKSARVIWTINHSDTGDTGQRQFDVTDNGEPVGGVPPDMFMDQGGCGGENQPSCDCTQTSNAGVLPLHGNIVVKGATQ